MMALPPGAAVVEFEAVPGDVLLLLEPPTLPGLSASVAVDGAEQIGVALSDFGPQRATVIRVARTAVTARYVWRPADEPTEWIWAPPDHALNRASPGLAGQVKSLVAGLPPNEAEAAIVQAAASAFRYGHGEDRFTDNLPSVPALSCGLTRGSCVDIHTYAVAALRAAGLRAAYVAGVFWPEGERTVADMHCWIATAPVEPSAWDVSHDVITGREPQPNFLARPGHRLPFSIGRGQRFRWADRAFEVSHFALPHKLMSTTAVEVPATFTRSA